MKKMAFFVLILFLFFSTTLNVYGSISTGLETVPMNINEKRDNFYLCETRFYGSKAGGLSYIESMAVNNNATEIALFLSNSRIEIYDNHGRFKRGYKLNTGKSIGLEFDRIDNNLCVYITGTEMIYKINAQGKVLNMEKIKKTEKNETYTSHLINKTEEIRNGKSYSLKGIGNTSIYYECILEEANNKIVIYNQKFKIILAAIFIPIIALSIFLGIGFAVLKAYSYSENN